MDVLGDAIGRERRSSEPALRAPAVGRNYDYRRFCTSAWKVGNFLRHLGVHNGVGVGVADDPLPEPVLTFYGAALLGGVVGFGPATDPGEEVRALVVANADLDAYEADLSTKRVVYGEKPDDPSVSYFERDVWSENPTEPPDIVSPDDLVLRADGTAYTHAEVLEAAEAAVEQTALESADAVVVSGPLTDPGVVVAGLVAPVVVAGTIVIGPGAEGDVVVGGTESDIDTDRILEESG
jgi:acyl-CoA synthetase (AMP-forming)/AMP-acid ligase II